MSNIQLKEVSVSKFLHAFKILFDHGIGCSMELHHGDASDPFISFSNELVTAEYIECAGGGDSIEITAGNTVLNFELGMYRCFGMHVGEKQIFFSISGDKGTAWFDSSEVTSEVINEILSFKVEEKATEFDEVEIINDLSDQLFDYFNLSTKDALYVVDKLKAKLEALRDEKP
ncbi:hypothetical protein [Paenibacillus sp. USDA918EY]|uniref:hypothetical protein n=1 Tax=Paenibacillus sp. USDA918EY TaxID=2689575 RepID=UPI0013569E14|nr:hypothetical protein [Paenibacillus sp. USDA918EY]